MAYHAQWAGRRLPTDTKIRVIQKDAEMQITAIPGHTETAHERTLLQDVMRWIAVLPAALGAFVGVQIAIIVISLVQSGFNEGPDYWAQFANSVAGTYFLVWAGAKTAPRHRYVTALALAVLYGIFTGAVFTLAIERGLYQSAYRWWDILCYVAGIISAIVACVHIRFESP